MEQVGDLVGAPGAADERPDGVGHDPPDVEVAGAERSGRLADDQQRAPRLATTGDRHRQLRPPIAEDRRGCGIGIVGIVQDSGQQVAAGPVPARGQIECLADHPVAGRQVDESEGPGHVGAGDGPRHQPVATRLPDRDEVVAVGVADRPDGSLERLVRVVERVDGPDDRRRHRQVELVAFRIERIGPSRLGRCARACGEACYGGGVDGPATAPRPGRDARHAVDGACLRGGQESLEVAQPVAPIATRVDPVVAQAARVAPRPDRVRVNAQKPGGLCDREGCIRWSRRDGRRHGLYRRKCEVSPARLPSSQFLTIGRWSQLPNRA